VAILKGRVAPMTLTRLDVEGSPLRPYGYYDADSSTRLISVDERQRRLRRADGSLRGAPDRCYTYQQLLWIGIFCYVEWHLEQAGAPAARPRAIRAIRRLQERNHGVLPSASRLVFFEHDVYLLADDGPTECLTDDGQQLAMRQILTDEIAAEVHGRVAVLAAHREDMQAPPIRFGMAAEGGRR
jgi:hypothetical protein